MTEEDFTILGTLRDDKIIWKTDELHAKYEAAPTQIVQSAKPARAYIISAITGERIEVTVHEIHGTTATVKMVSDPRMFHFVPLDAIQVEA